VPREGASRRVRGEGGLRGLLQTAEGFFRAAGVRSELAEERVELVREKEGQNPAKAVFPATGVPRDALLTSLFLALVESEEALSPTLGRLRIDIRYGAEGAGARVLLPERLA
jgi:hypothetical protein